MEYTHTYEIKFSNGQEITGEIVFNGICESCITISGAELSLVQMQLLHSVMDALRALYTLSNGFVSFEILEK